MVQQEHEVVTGDHIFNEAGYAVLAGSEPTRDNSYLAIRTGFPSNAHRHSDDFSFEWSEKGQVIFQDSGRYSYDYKSPLRVFVSSTRAHNTVTVDGKNYPWWGDFEKKDFYEGAVKQYSGGVNKSTILLSKEYGALDVSFDRKLEIVKGQSLTVTDALKSKSERCYEQWFHFSEFFDYLGEGDDGSLIFSSEALSVKVFAPIGVEVFIVKGQEAPDIQGWVSYKEKSVIPRWSVGFEKNAKSFTFKTKFLIF